ncbi:MAG: peptidogalycan biosysnthesis protein [Methylobacter sp.]|nr:peptidogalycan biosysnthesis protein [Methylobacter sp.]
MWVLCVALRPLPLPLQFPLDHRGAQSEHKIARSSEPISTYSAHRIEDARFANAVEYFLTREQKTVQHYKQEATSYLPFRQ